MHLLSFTYSCLQYCHVFIKLLRFCSSFLISLYICISTFLHFYISTFLHFCVIIYVTLSRFPIACCCFRQHVYMFLLYQLDVELFFYILHQHIYEHTRTRRRARLANTKTSGKKQIQGLGCKGWRQPHGLK